MRKNIADNSIKMRVILRKHVFSLTPHKHTSSSKTVVNLFDSSLSAYSL